MTVISIEMIEISNEVLKKSDYSFSIARKTKWDLTAS